MTDEEDSPIVVLSPAEIQETLDRHADVPGFVAMVNAQLDEQAAPPKKRGWWNQGHDVIS